MHSKTLSLLIFIAAITVLSGKLTCLDRNGVPTPWFALMKLPPTVTKTSPRYAYLDPNSGASFQMIQGAYCDGQSEPLTRTIREINAISPDDKSLLLFNDEIPATWLDDPSLMASSDAHAKGIIAFDNHTQSGVYIMHSMPLFPLINKATAQINPTIPVTPYAQHGYCISLDKELLGKLLQNIPLQKPRTYFATGAFVDLKTNSTDNFKVSQFNLLNGEAQWFLTKNPKYDGFLFENIVGPYFKTNLAVESWGRPYQKALCPPTYSYSTVNINVVAFKNGDSWSHGLEHSKWAVTTDKDKKLACFCDMNRMESQNKRGGSCFCNTNPNIFAALSSLIAQTDSCSAGDFLMKKLNR